MSPVRSLSTRFVQVLLVIVMVGMVSGWFRLALAGTRPVRAAPFAARSSSDTVGGLREVDRFLDHHPLLEDQLRSHPGLLDDPAFVSRNPEWKGFILAHPTALAEMKTHPDYLLERGLIHQAIAPVAVGDLAPLLQLLRSEHALRQLLSEHPEAIRDPAFLAAHPVLRDCLSQYPILQRVFAPSPAAR